MNEHLYIYILIYALPIYEYIYIYVYILLHEDDSIFPFDSYININIYYTPVI